MKKSKKKGAGKEVDCSATHRELHHAGYTRSANGNGYPKPEYPTGFTR
jgi:hypothetical protein